jgi:hypothetical protein
MMTRTAKPKVTYCTSKNGHPIKVTDHGDCVVIGTPGERLCWPSRTFTNRENADALIQELISNV